jgi:hypothetical protein
VTSVRRRLLIHLNWNEHGMPAKSFRALFVEELREMYDGQKPLYGRCRGWPKAAESADLKTAFTMTDRPQ